VKVKDIMTSPVISIGPDATIMQAVQIMLQRRISGLPVISQDGHLVGIVTEGDFLRRIETGTQRVRPRWLEFVVGPGRLADEYTHSYSRKVADVMTRDPITVNEETLVTEIVDLMEKHQIKRVPVVAGEHVVGIVTRANLLHALASVSREAQPSAQRDEVIRSLLLAEFADQRRGLLPLIYVNPIVCNGIVELWGAITDERERRALVVAAENVAGVKEVRDHVLLVDPISGTVVYQPENNPR
jgi:CBS domain-containing protein